MSDSEQAFTEWSQKQIDTLWAERQRLEAENDSLRAQLAVSDRELRRWRGCPACKQDHDSSTDCPPHEVRIKGRAWFHTQARDWEERAKLAEEQLAEMTVAKDRVALQLREKISWSDSEVAKLIDERSQWMNKFELAEARSNRLRDRADIAEVARDLAEVRRDEWKAIATREREEGVQQHLRLAELGTERDAALARVKRLEEIARLAKALQDNAYLVCEGKHLKSYDYALADWRKLSEALAALDATGKEGECRTTS